MATTLAWGTHPQKLVTFLGRACAPHGIFFQGIVAPGRRANVIEGVREIRKAVGHIFGANFRHMHLLYIIHVVYETYDTHERDTTVGHIFGARAGGFSIFFEKVVRFHMFY